MSLFAFNTWRASSFCSLTYLVIVISKIASYTYM
jgi:hypothetical protein